MNNKDSKKNLAFLFGAGAEIDFNLPSGFDFLKQTILLSDSDESVSVKEMKNGINSFFREEYFIQNGFGKEKLYKHEKSFFRDKDLKKRLYAEYVFDRKKEQDFYPNELKDKIFENGKLKTEKDNCIRAIKESFSDKTDGLTEKETDFFKKCEREFQKDVDAKDASLEINRYIAGVLDSYFHTIINPVKFGVRRFSKIFNYYWACYFSIVHGILKNIDKHDPKYKDFYDGEKLFYKKILENLELFTTRLYEDSNSFLNEKSYYHFIKKYLKENPKYSLSGVITTNFFDFAERELKELYENLNATDFFAYPNGQLKMFEFPELLEVKDIKESEDCITNGSRLFFPFIFGQSYVKPIIHPIQIREFSKISKILSNADFLVILGFGINEDDNHLNTYLHDFANSHKILIVTNEKECDALPKYKSRLRLEKDNLHICSVNFNNDRNEANVEKIFECLSFIDREL